MEELIENLKVDIVKVLNLEEVSPSDIDTEAPLFIEGLGLDSIDALELIVLLEKKYNFKIPTAEEGKRILHSVRTMAEGITANSKK